MTTRAILLDSSKPAGSARPPRSRRFDGISNDPNMPVHARTEDLGTGLPARIHPARLTTRRIPLRSSWCSGPRCPRRTAPQSVTDAPVKTVSPSSQTFPPGISYSQAQRKPAIPSRRIPASPFSGSLLYFQPNGIDLALADPRHVSAGRLRSGAQSGGITPPTDTASCQGAARGETGKGGQPKRPRTVRPTTSPRQSPVRNTIERMISSAELLKDYLPRLQHGTAQSCRRSGRFAMSTHPSRPTGSRARAPLRRRRGRRNGERCGGAAAVQGGRRAHARSRAAHRSRRAGSYVNEALARDLGIPAEQLVGHTPEERGSRRPSSTRSDAPFAGFSRPASDFAGDVTASTPTGLRTYSYTVTPLSGCGRRGDLGHAHLARRDLARGGADFACRERGEIPEPGRVGAGHAI